MGGVDTEVPSNLVNHVAQLTKQLQRQQGVVNAFKLTLWRYANHVEDSTVLRNANRAR